MINDAVTADLTEPQPLHCYRHPDRETWVRCGRCDQPICMGCAMQGPVGLRCKTCGKPSRDALASMRPIQVAVGALVAGGLGAAVGYFSAQYGWFVIVVGFFAGTLIAEALDRTVGIKRGPQILRDRGRRLVVGGLIGGGLSVTGMWRDFQVFAASPEAEGMPDSRSTRSCCSTCPSVLIALAATVVGVWTTAPTLLSRPRLPERDAVRRTRPGPRASLDAAAASVVEHVARAALSGTATSRPPLVCGSCASVTSSGVHVARDIEVVAARSAGCARRRRSRRRRGPDRGRRGARAGRLPRRRSGCRTPGPSPGRAPAARTR